MRWNALDLDGLSERAARVVLADRGLAPEQFEISILACDDARIARLNAAFRSIPEATNVLSWPAVERGSDVEGTVPSPPPAGTRAMPGELGDIALAWETCEREAVGAGKNLESHVLHLLVHGILHLLGFDHVRDKDAALMEAIEVRILARLGVCDPYG